MTKKCDNKKKQKFNNVQARKSRLNICTWELSGGTMNVKTTGFKTHPFLYLSPL